MLPKIIFNIFSRHQKNTVRVAKMQPDLVTIVQVRLAWFSTFSSTVIPQAFPQDMHRTPVFIGQKLK